MKTIVRGFFYCIVIISTTQFGCNSPEETASMQPMEGYPFTSNIEEIHALLETKCLDTIEFTSGEIIADIGAGNGYVEAMLSIFYDSLTFYIQDIDSAVCNETEIKKVFDYYQEVKGKPIANKFIVVNGTDTTTNLPNDAFDKILMLWTYSYLKEPTKLINDIRNKLKDDGLFYVINPSIEESDYTKSLRTKYSWNVSPLEKQIDDIISCGYILVRISRNYDSGDFNEPVIMLFRKKSYKP